MINIDFTVSFFLDSQFSENTPPTIHLNRNWILRETEPVGYIVERVQVEGSDRNKLEYGLEVKNSAGSTALHIPLPFTIDNSTGVIALNETLEGRVRKFLYLNFFFNILNLKKKPNYSR